MLKKAVFRILSGFISLCIACHILFMPCSAQASGYEFYTIAHSNLYSSAFPIRLYYDDNQLYIDDFSLAGVSGYERISHNEFYLNGHTIFLTNSRLVSHTRYYPLESTLKAFAVKVWAKDNELYFLSGQVLVQPLLAADSESWRFSSLVDKNNGINTFGTALAHIWNIITTWDFKPLLDQYRDAMYSLVQEDLNTESPSALQKKIEDEIALPLSTILGFLEKGSTDAQVKAFYQCGALRSLTIYLEGLELTEKALGMPLSEYLGRLEEISLLLDTNVYVLEAMKYTADTYSSNYNHKQIISAAQEITDCAHMDPADWSTFVFCRLSKEHVSSLFSSGVATFLKNAMLSKNELAEKTIKLIAQNLPVAKNMEGLRTAYTLAILQDFFKTQVSLAKESGDWIRMKYMLIMYYRCFYASCEALKSVEMQAIDPNWKSRMDTLKNDAQDQLLSIACIPNSILEYISTVSPRISPDKLLHQNIMADMYSSLVPFPVAENEEDITYNMEQIAFDIWEEYQFNNGFLELKEYNGKIFMDEGSGAVLPFLSSSGGLCHLIILVQDQYDLYQVIYRIERDGTYELVFKERLLSVGSRDRLYLYAQSDTGLLAELDADIDIFAYAAGTEKLEEYLFLGDADEDGIAAMGLAARAAFRSIFGEPQWDVMVDANYGQFMLEIQDPYSLKRIFYIDIP